MSIEHEIVVVGAFQCNCSIVSDSETKEAIIVDPGDEPHKIIAAVQKRGLTVKYLLHTHAHLDHINGTKGVKHAVGGTICLHKDDEEIYNNLPMQGKFFGYNLEAPLPVEKFLQDEEILQLTNFKIQTIHTPGHSPGGLCYKLNDDLIFSGDTLFEESIGRTDLWGGNTETLLSSIKNRLFTLEDDLPVFPGHGSKTSIGLEKRNNPFFQ